MNVHICLYNNGFQIVWLQSQLVAGDFTRLCLVAGSISKSPYRYNQELINHDHKLTPEQLWVL